MADKKNTPFSAFEAARKIREYQSKTDEASGMSSPTYTQKEKLKPTSTPYDTSGDLTMGKVASMAKTAADVVGLDGSFGFQNSFGSIKGMGKTKKKK